MVDIRADVKTIVAAGELVRVVSFYMDRLVILSMDQTPKTLNPLISRMQFNCDFH